MIGDRSDQVGAFDLSAYLARIGHRGALERSASLLRELQAAHIASIPFEAIDVVLGKGISIDPADVFDKLVRRGRGGYCYEQNGLIRTALERLGFAVEARIARVLWGGAGEGDFQPRTHMTLLVDCGETWLVDVGFGSAVPVAPLNWNSEAAQDTAHGTYRLVERQFGRRLEIFTGDSWKPIYEIFDEVPHPEEFEVANWFTSTHPQSPFMRNLIVARATSTARLTLFGSEFTVRSTDEHVSRTTLDAAGLEDVLRHQFNLPIEARWIPILSVIASTRGADLRQ